MKSLRRRKPAAVTQVFNEGARANGAARTTNCQPTFSSGGGAIPGSTATTGGEMETGAKHNRHVQKVTTSGAATFRASVDARNEPSSIRLQLSAVCSLVP